MDERPLGSVVIDEQIFPIHRITLVAEAFRMEAHVHGPRPAANSTSYFVLGRDGRVVYRSVGSERVVFPALADGECATLVVCTRADNRTTVRTESTVVVDYRLEP